MPGGVLLLPSVLIPGPPNLHIAPVRSQYDPCSWSKHTPNDDAVSIKQIL